MTVKELKEVISTSTSITLFLSESKEDVFKERFLGKLSTFKYSNDNHWDNFQVINIYPREKDDLEVWCIK